MSSTHEFDIFTYSRPTYCDLCDKFLWGIVKQGCQCRDCGYNVHKKCRALVASPCTGVRAPGVNNFNQGHFEKPRGAAKHTNEEESDDEGDDETEPRITRSKSSGSIPTLATTDSQAPAVPKSGLLPSVMQDLMASTAKASVDLKQAVKNSSPPLNLLTTTPKNFTRFVSRLGPVVATFEFVEGIMTWKDPSQTLIALLAFIILCIYPVLFMVLPQLGLIFYIGRQYYKKTKLEVITGKPVTFASSANGPTTAQYIKNMQFIQNQMGMYCDVYAEVRRSSKILDWSDEKATLEALKGAAISAVAVVVVLKLIPLNLIILVAGLGAFFSNTALFRAASTTLPPVIMKGLQDRVDSIREGIAAARKAPEGSTVTIELFENQRWWAGLGWIPHLLRSERAPWSDDAGTISRPAKDAFELPAEDPAGVWRWVDEDWQLDRHWTEQDDGGWRYSDHLWGESTPKATVGSLTRRRKWVRQMRMTPNSIVAGVAQVAEAVSLKKSE